MPSVQIEDPMLGAEIKSDGITSEVLQNTAAGYIQSGTDNRDAVHG